MDPNPPPQTSQRKPPDKVTVPPDAKLLVSRKEAAVIVSLSLRSIDGLLASKQLPFRKIGNRTLIPLAALQRFARMDHPDRIAS
jgi:excisionase family DNA binding protein